nr:uncharacterized oxidoreductase At4g09670-like [Tanacetum cinerariifolium]
MLIEMKSSKNHIMRTKDNEANETGIRRQLLLLWKTAAHSYDAVLDDPDKHILLEKPIALNVGKLDTMLEAWESSWVQFMDATMWMYHPGTAKMKEFLFDQHKFGQMKIGNGVINMEKLCWKWFEKTTRIMLMRSRACQLHISWNSCLF